MLRHLDIGLTIVLVSACDRAGSQADRTAGDRGAITDAMQAYTRALEIGPDTIMRWWADDGVYINQSLPTLRGRPMIDSVVTAVHSSWQDVKATITTDELIVDGDHAYLIGSYSETFLLKSGTEQQLQGRTLASDAPQQVSGRFMFVWRRQPDGNWRIARAIGTDMGPPQ